MEQVVSETSALVPKKTTKSKYSWFNTQYDPRPRAQRRSSAAIFDVVTYGGFTAAALIQTIEEVNIPVHFFKLIDVFAAELCKIGFMSLGSLSLIIDLIKHEPNKWALANKLIGILAANLWVSTGYSFLRETSATEIIAIISIFVGILVNLSNAFQKGSKYVNPRIARLTLREGAEQQPRWGRDQREAKRKDALNLLLYLLVCSALFYHPLKERVLIRFIKQCTNNTNSTNITAILTEVESQLNRTELPDRCTDASISTGIISGAQGITLTGAAVIHIYNVINSSELTKLDKTLHTLGAVSAITWVAADSLEPLLSPITEGFKFGSMCVFFLMATILLSKSIYTAVVEKDVTEDVEFANSGANYPG